MPSQQEFTSYAEIHETHTGVVTLIGDRAPWFDAHPVDTSGELADAHKHAIDAVVGRLR